MQKITPKTKRTRVHSERYDVCPHCKEEIREKATYVDPEGYEFHRNCQDKGPIGKIDMHGMKFGTDGFSIPEPKTASALKTASDEAHGKFEKNVAGKDYVFGWMATKADPNSPASPVNVIATQPDDMPDYLWFQVRDAANGDAKKAADRHAIEVMKIRNPMGTKASNWLERAISKTAQFADVDGPTDDYEDDEDGHHKTAAKKGGYRKCPECHGKIEKGDFSCPDCGRDLSLPPDQLVRDEYGRITEFLDWVEPRSDDGRIIDEHAREDLRQQLFASKTAASAYPKRKLVNRDPTPEEINLRHERSRSQVGQDVRRRLGMEGEPIDESLLADGLGAFLDVFVNYHSGKEGDKLAKWIIAICNDPKYSQVADKLQEFHRLMGDIYKETVEIANQDEAVRGKVAAVLKRIRTASKE